MEVYIVSIMLINVKMSTNVLHFNIYEHDDCLDMLRLIIEKAITSGLDFNETESPVKIMY